MKKLLLLLPPLILITGCVNTAVQTRPVHKKYQPSDFKQPAKLFTVRLEADFSPNGNLLPQANNLLFSLAEDSLKNSRIAVPYAQAANGLKISGNNIADVGGTF
ncbi:hypothetical protein C7N83_08170 [Neisseria iguanae]|uniref:Uncharacterized protein n=2 Tax=Neisseria iguanae TaxID=90242 RepID=A0A2P7TZF0_9NEIS|nr:hypothetical protein C7N83_08170 [Neisseria iguanae]